MPVRIVVLLIGAIGGAITSIVSPYCGVLMLLFLNFGRPQDDRPNVVALHIPMMITLAVVIGLLLRVGKSVPEFLVAIKKLGLVMLFFGLMIISGVLHWTELSKSRIDDFSTLVFFCVMTLTVVTTEKRLRGYIQGVLFSGFYVVVRVLRNPSKIVEQIGDQNYERAAIAKGAAVFGNSNYLALFMVLTMILSITMLACYRKLWQRVVLVALMGGAGYVFFRANSRGASIALACCSLVLWFFSNKKLKMAVGLVVLLVSAAFFAPDSYWSRLSTVATYQEDTSATTRLMLWNIALALIPEHPIFGVGPDNFTLYAPNTPHDAYLQVASEIGLPALLVYISILICGLRASIQTRKISSRGQPGSSDFLHAASLGVFCCVLAVTIQGFTTGLAHREVVYVFVTLALCLRCLAQQQAVYETKSSSTQAGAVSGVPVNV